MRLLLGRLVSVKEKVEGVSISPFNSEELEAKDNVLAELNMYMVMAYNYLLSPEKQNKELLLVASPESLMDDALIFIDAIENEFQIESGGK